MPLPALPSSKNRSRLPETPNSSVGRRESSGSGIPTPTSGIPTPSSSTRKTTPIGLARLRTPAVQSTTSLASPTKDSPSSPLSPTSPTRRREFRKTVSIGSFPQPPKGGFGTLGSISSSPESTPSLPSSTKANTPLAQSSRATSPATLAESAKTRSEEEDDLFPPRSSSLAVTSVEHKKLSLIEERRASEAGEIHDGPEDYNPPRSNSLAVTSNEHKKLSQIEENRKSQQHVKLSIFPAAEPSSRRASKAESLPIPKFIASPAIRQDDSGIKAPMLRRKSSSPLLRQGPLLSEPITSGLPFMWRKASSPLLRQIRLPEDPPSPPPPRVESPEKESSPKESPSKEVSPTSEIPSLTQIKESTPSPKSATSRTSGLPTIKGKRTASIASSTRKSDRHLNIPSDFDSRPSSANGSAITDGTQFEDIDPLTVPTSAPTSKPRGRSRPSDAGSIRSLRSTKSESNLKFGKEYSKEGKDMKGNVVVSVRVRPNGSDTTANPDWIVDNNSGRISYKGGEGGDFRYDNVFSNGDDNGRVYDSAAKRLVRRVMEGYHGTVFAYGCTSTGKTFSMQGTAASPGIIPLAITDIFSFIREQPHREFLLRVSYLEIYNEKIYDLLSPSAGAAMQEEIKLREDSKRGVYATPLKEEIVQSPTQLLRVIARGDLCRRTGSTQFNTRSSRSHAVVQIVVESRARVDPSSTSALPSGVLVSTLSLIDLAGSERAAEDKDRRKEGSHINKSLLTLGTVISRLSEQKPDATALPSKSHLPYRDSKLTRLLSSALSGNALISILCTIQLSPMGAFGPLNAMAAPSETLNTLTFASRAKNNIVSRAKRNESIPGLGGEARALLDRYKTEIEDLRQQLEQQTRNSQDGAAFVENKDVVAPKERTEEEERKWAERERESMERHEAQMLEMQLARTALKERIGHLNRLILSSKSAGVNVRVKDRRAPAPDEVGVALGSPEVSRSGSVTEVVERPGYQRAFSLGSAGLSRGVGLGFVAGEALAEESDEEEDGVEGESGEASPAARIRALQADVRDKNRYIATLERRLLEARRTSGGKRRKSSGVGAAGWEDVVAEKDREIEELKKRLDDAAKMGNALRSAARRRDMVDVTGQGLGLGNGLSIDVSKGRKMAAVTSPTGQGHGHTLSTSSSGSRSINFSRLTPVGILSPSKAGFPEDGEVERPMDSGKSLRSEKSLEEMTRMLDGMIAQKVEEGVPGLFGVKAVMQVTVGDAR
ncbi:Kinesin motor domain-containing protein 6 [Elsinoe fawcettii]|nr:Kinesin motor domain-containing protein 6 [Elsinoe fawcettii]